MTTAIIIDAGQNESLLRFTETKLFFGADNQSTDFIDNCITVSSFDEAIASEKKDTKVVIISTGDFLTTSFREKYKDVNGLIIPTSEDEIIKFNPTTYVGFKKRADYPQGSKQLYIIENMLKTILRNKELVYLNNTEPRSFFEKKVKHLYGLASGWKTIDFAQQIGLENLESITVYDTNPTQLKFAKWLHDQPTLPMTIDPIQHSSGEYDPPMYIAGMWAAWHAFPVKFKQIDLFTAPEFPKNSAVWISNVFNYEPNIFNFGWKACKQAKERLINTNKESIIFTI